MRVESARIFREYGDDCVVTIRVDNDGMCAIMVETEEGYFSVPGIPEELLLDVLDRLEEDEPDDIEYQ